MTPRKLHKTFDILDNPWWHQYSSTERVDDLLDRISNLRETTKKQIKAEDPYWKGYVNVHHTKYLLECIAGESNNNKLTYDDMEQMVDAGLLRMLWNFLFYRKKYRIMRKVKSLNQAAKMMFPDTFLFEPYPVKKLSIEFVRQLHQQVGKGVIPNTGKFRTKDAKPAQENFFYLSPHLIEHRLQNLLTECQQVFSDPNLSLEDAVKYGACFLSEFLLIHPFSNGNGRVGRLLLSYLLTKYTVVPLSLYSSNSARDTYLQCLRDSRDLNAEVNKPASLSRFILENIEREFVDLHYLMALNDS